MNVSKVKPTEWLVVAGGALVVVFGLLRWFSWDIKVGDDLVTKGKSNAFDYLLTGVLPWLLVGGAALVTILLASGAIAPSRVPWPLVILAATALGALLILVRVIIGEDPDTLVENAKADVSRGMGLWLSALGAILAAVGAFLTYQANAFDSRTSGPGSRPQPDRELPPTSA